MQFITHFVLIVPLLVTTPSITLDPNVPLFVKTSSTEQSSNTLAPALVENLDIYTGGLIKCCFVAFLI